MLLSRAPINSLNIHALRNIIRHNNCDDSVRRSVRIDVMARYFAFVAPRNVYQTVRSADLRVAA